MLNIRYLLSIKTNIVKKILTIQILKLPQRVYYLRFQPFRMRIKYIKYNIVHKQK